jgi:hypothetical protein
MKFKENLGKMRLKRRGREGSGKEEPLRKDEFWEKNLFLTF